MYLTRNQAWVQIHRGFESHPLRQIVKLITRLMALFISSPQLSPQCAPRLTASKRKFRCRGMVIATVLDAKTTKVSTALIRVLIPNFMYRLRYILTSPLVDFSQPTPRRTPTPVNRRLHCSDLCTVFCSNYAVRALKSHPKVASTQVGVVSYQQ